MPSLIKNEQSVSKNPQALATIKCIYSWYKDN